MGGVGGLALFLSVRLGGLFPGLGIDDEAVGEDGFVGRFVTHSDAEHEGALEPAAVLVGGLQVEVGGAAELGASI